jgi:hypothetical protein
MGEFEYGASPSGSPSPDHAGRPEQSFEPQSFAPQAFQQESIQTPPVAQETFARVAYPPATTPSVQQQSAYPPQAPWDNSAPRSFSAPYVPAVSWSPASTKRNWMGVTSVVLACLGGGPLGIVFGWLGVVAARESRATNGRLARWGVILNVAVPLVIVGVVLAVHVTGESKNTNGAQWASVSVGDCLAPTNGTSDGSGPVTPKRAACAGEHWSQVYYTGTLAEGSGSRDAAVMQKAKEMCVREATTRLDPARIADAYPTIIVPDEKSWAANERWVVCLVSNVDGSITGSWVAGF